MTETRMSLRGVLAHHGKTADYITPSTQRVMDALTSEYQDNGGWPVHVRPLMKLSGFRSSSVVHDHLHRLEQSGLVERGPTVKDGWRPRDDR